MFSQSAASAATARTASGRSYSARRPSRTTVLSTGPRPQDSYSVWHPLKRERAMNRQVDRRDLLLGALVAFVVALLVFLLVLGALTLHDVSTAGTNHSETVHLLHQICRAVHATC